ncbi:MAG TPA: hypothetical protein VN577_01635 [Terriglobales bacterium]|nr:hypothetical protein [Terriglobales bacterium]
MPSFYFEQLLQRGLSGIDQQGITTAVLQIAGVILVFSLLWSVYEAYSNGGDVGALGVAALKYLILGIVFINYPSAFRAVNSMFNSVADGIYNLSGGLDAVQSWLNSLSQAWNTNPDWFSAIWNLVSGGAASTIASIITLAGYVLLPVTYTLFCLFYALYGAILYVVGPFVLALMPSRSMGQLARSFLVNLTVFHFWGLLYAIFQSLMSALQITDPMQLTGSFLNAFSGSSQMIVMSLASLLLSIMIALIPFIASRIVRGDMGSTLMTVVGAAATLGAAASGLALAGGEGVGAGRVLAAEGPPPPPSTDRGGNSPAPSASSLPQSQSLGGAVSAIGQSTPPTPLNTETGAAQSAGSAPNPSHGTLGLGTSSGHAGAADATTSAGVETAVDAGASAGTGASAETGAATTLRNPRSGQVFTWNGSGWEEAGHVGSFPSATYGTTRWTGGSGGPASRGYNGRSLAGLAAWRAGHMIGTTMRLVGMGRHHDSR